MLEESPVYETIMPLLPTQTREQRIDDLAATTRDYAARGITTAVDAALFSYDDAELLRTVRGAGGASRSGCTSIPLRRLILTIRGWRSMGRM